MISNPNIFYIDKGHRYQNIETGEYLTSVTTKIKQYQKTFDTEYWLTYKSNQLNIDREEIRLNWDIKREVGTWLGSLTHSYIENYKQNKIIDLTPSPFLSSLLSSPQFLFLLQHRDNLINQANNFLHDYADYDYIGSEIVVGNNQIAGQIDYLTKQCILDFKVDKEIKYSNKYQRFYKPLNHLEDCNYNKYCLQVSMYRYLLEEKGVTLPEADKIVKFNRYSTEYEVIEIPYLKHECELILNNIN